MWELISARKGIDRLIIGGNVESFHELANEEAKKKPPLVLPSEWNFHKSIDCYFSHSDSHSLITYHLSVR